MRWYRNIKLGPKLIALFLIVGLAPLAVAAFVSYSTASDALHNEDFAKLHAIRMIKTNQVKAYIQTLRNLMHLLKDNAITQQALAALEAAYMADKREGKLNVNAKVLGTTWSKAVAKYHAGFKDIMDDFGLYDIFLIADDGDVVYTVTRKPDLGQNLITGPLKSSGLGKVFAKALKLNNKVAIADFAPYAPSGNKPACFLAGPVTDASGKLLGVVAIQLPLAKINAIMKERSGMGKTGETYLVGPDKLMRSDSFLDPKNHTVAASFARPDKGKVDTEASRNALAGQTGAKIIIDYNGNPVLSDYAPLKVLGLRWAILAEIDEAEAFAPVKRLRNIVVVIGLIIAALVALLAFMVARSIANPVKHIVRASEAIAGGDYNAQIKLDSKDEIGKLAESLRQTLSKTITQMGEGQSIKGGIPDPFFTVDTDMRITLINRGCEQMLGKSNSEVVGKFTCQDLFQAHSCGTEECMIKKAIKTGEPVIGAKTSVSIEGRDVPLSVTASQLTDLDGNPIGGMEIIRDITADVEAENQIREQQANLMEVAQEVTGLAEQLASASAEVSASTEQMAASTEQQSAQSETVATTTEQMSATVQEAAVNAAKGAEEAAKAGEIAVEGGELAEQTAWPPSTTSAKTRPKWATPSRTWPRKPNRSIPSSTSSKTSPTRPTCWP